MLCILQVMDFLLVVVRLRLIMSGDVELNPGPLDGEWNVNVLPIRANEGLWRGI